MFEKVAVVEEVTRAGVHTAPPTRHLEEGGGLEREDAHEGVGGPTGHPRPPQSQHLHLPSWSHESSGGVNGLWSMPLGIYRDFVVEILFQETALCEI